MARRSTRRRRRAGPLARRRGAAPGTAPEPPVRLPPGFVVHVPGRGELFVRDTGGPGPALLLLHGWMVSADLNWFRAYAPLAEAGYRVIALDHRGHGRGLRTPEPFRLSDCAADAAAAVDVLGAGPVTAVGYSMGGPVAQLMARDHREQVRGVVLCATSREWRDPRTRAIWYGMGALRLVLGLFPEGAWRAGLRSLGLTDTPATTWVAAELSRGSSSDVAEAGRELGRFDSRPWVGSLGVPAAVVVTSRDEQVPVAKQRALARALFAPTFDVDAEHLAVTSDADAFHRALFAALDAIGAGAGAGADRAAAAAG